MANKLNIERESGALRIDYSWKTPGMWFLAFFAIVWNLFVFFFLIMGAGFLAGFFVIFHVLAGVFIGWYALSRLFNKTTIMVDQQKMLMEHGPIPWPFSKAQHIPARSLVQLYVERSSVKINDKPTYQLMAKLDTGVIVKLVNAELDKQLLLDLEHTIEAYLNIKNDTSFDLGEKGDFEGLDLEQMKAQLEKLKKLKQWLPGGVVKQMELAEEKILRETAAGGSVPYRSAGKSSPVSGSSGKKDDGFFSRAASSGPRPLPEPDHNFVYPLYHASEGDAFTYLGKPYRLGRSAQIDWTDKHITTGRQLEAQGAGSVLHIYAQNERERWAYYEERRLDDDEVEHLGFIGDTHPNRFDNGSERYYPRDEQTGTRYMGRVGEAVQQFIYFTTSSGTLFRALKPVGRGWEVYVMEVVDGGSFEKG